jgi:RNA polymerase sigma factor (sigma-70 family)
MSDKQAVYLMNLVALIRSRIEQHLTDMTVGTFASVQEFIDAVPADSPGCMMTDLEMSNETAAEILKQLRDGGHADLPVIFVVRDGDIASAACCMKVGAVDVMERSVRLPRLLASLQEAFVENQQRRIKSAAKKTALKQLASLNPREREVLQLTCQGIPGQQISHQLGIEVSTVSRHLTNCISKSRAGNFATLFQIAKAASFSFSRFEEPKLAARRPLKDSADRPIAKPATVAKPRLHAIRSRPIKVRQAA